jgi:predicted RNA-binding Zn-ribbon protein involved in translation (DUF1610 family)
MPCCPNCDNEMVSPRTRSNVRDTKTRSSDQSGPRNCPSCGYSE